MNRVVRALAVAAAGSALIGLGCLAPAKPLAVHGTLPAAAARLQQPLAYLVLAPVARLLDELSLLEKDQHIAVLGTVLIFAITCGSWRARAAPSRRVLRFGAGVLAVLAAVVAFYAFGALAPRPMVALRLSGDSLMAVDFHSHTSASHDGRWDFTAEDNRDWHSAAGFGASYLTDHQTMDAWRAFADGGAPDRSADAASPDGWATVLLPGLETHAPGVHVNLLGTKPEHLHILLPGRDVDVAAMEKVLAGEDAPLLLVTLPYNPERLGALAGSIGAIELTDASPRGLEFTRHMRARHVALAESLGVALVAASNNHGWGRTAAAWTVLRVIGWRQLDPLSLDRAIRQALRETPREVSVVERRGLRGTDGGVATALTAPRLAVHLARVLTPAERVSWFVWIWAVALASAWRRGRPTAPPQASHR